MDSRSKKIAESQQMVVFADQEEVAAFGKDIAGIGRFQLEALIDHINNMLASQTRMILDVKPDDTHGFYKIQGNIEALEAVKRLFKAALEINKSI